MAKLWNAAYKSGSGKQNTHVATSCTQLRKPFKFTYIIRSVFLLVLWPFKFNNCFAFRTRWCAIICHVFMQGTEVEVNFIGAILPCENHGCYISNPKRSIASKIGGKRRNRKIYHYNRTIVNWVIKSGGLR